MSSPFELEKRQQQKKLAELPDKLDDYQAPPSEQPADDKQSAKKARERERARQLLVERIIEDAMANGDFDDLPGKGKPLKFIDNPYLEPGQELAFGLLKKNGFAPEWIERDKEIRREMARLRDWLQRLWQLRQTHEIREAKWQAAVAQFKVDLNKLNCKIDDLNLMVPAVSLHRSRLRLGDELRRIKNSPQMDTD